MPPGIFDLKIPGEPTASLGLLSLACGARTFKMKFDPRVGDAFRDSISYFNVDMWETWEKISCPVLILRGKNSSFLTEDIAMLRSKLVRKGQKMADGTAMADRHIHHLRVLRRMDGQWRIVSHLISQSQPKTMVTDD